MKAKRVKRKIRKDDKRKEEKTCQRKFISLMKQAWYYDCNEHWYHFAGSFLRIEDSVFNFDVFRQRSGLASYSHPVYFVIWPVSDVVLHFQSKQTIRHVLAQVLENKSKVRLVQLQGQFI